MKYAGMPYSLDKLDVDLEGMIDLQKDQPSFVKLNRFCVQGTDVDVDLNGRVDQLLSNPLITANVKADAQNIPDTRGCDINGKFECRVKRKGFVG